MIRYPNAKINLGLNIVSKRADGFHDIESVFLPVPIFDILEIKENNHDQHRFFSSGIEIPGDGNSNLVMKAIALLEEKHQLPSLDVHLHKQIPIGAGLGGGSADASFALKLINDKFQLNLADEELESIALNIGSDCPFFIKNKAVLATGRGEVFSSVDVDLKGKYLVLVYPAIHVSTSLAYSKVVPKKAENNVRDIMSEDLILWKSLLKNDFEDSVFPEFPEIEKIKTYLYENDATYASMSGSGSSVFGLFEAEPELDLNHFGMNWIVQL